MSAKSENSELKESAADSQSYETMHDGVLLNLRLLKQFKRTINNKAVVAFFLGTAEDYHPKKKTANGSSFQGGNYTVRFDFGETQEMSPDEVIQFANTFYQQVSLVTPR